MANIPIDLKSECGYKVLSVFGVSFGKGATCDEFPQLKRTITHTRGG